MIIQFSTEEKEFWIKISDAPDWESEEKNRRDDAHAYTVLSLSEEEWNALKKLIK